MAKKIVENITTSNSNSDINDIRVATDSAAPTDSNFNTLNGRAATTGDIYLKTSDYDSGTIGNWNYIARADGVIEIWRNCTSTSFSYPSTWGSYIKYNNAVITGSQLNYPSNITFTEPPAVFCTITQMGGANSWLYAINGSSSTSTVAPKYGCCRANAASTNSTNFVTILHVIGVGTIS